MYRVFRSKIMSSTRHVTVVQSTITDFPLQSSYFSKVCLFAVKSGLAVCALCEETVRTEGCSLWPRNAAFISEITD